MTTEEVEQLKAENERLRAALEPLLEVALDVVADGKDVLSPGLIALAKVAIARALKQGPDR